MSKSVLMQDYIDFVAVNEPKANIIMINLQELEFDNLLEYYALHEYVLSKYIKNQHNLVFIDEVQLCDKFELAINSLHSKGIFDIYITGSNAFLLSSDMATLFTGRVMQIKIYPFSFTEYMKYIEYSQDMETAFENYSMYGGMSGSYIYDDSNHKQEYIREIYRTILIRDLVDKYKIRNEAEFKSIAELMMDNVGNLLSPNNICNCLNNNKSVITRKRLALEADDIFAAIVSVAGIGKNATLEKYVSSDSNKQLWNIFIPNGHHSWPDEKIVGFNVNQIIMDFFLSMQNKN